MHTVIHHIIIHVDAFARRHPDLVEGIACALIFLALGFALWLA